MSDILAEVLRLEEAGQYQEAINFLLSQSTETKMILSGLAHLMKHQRFAAAHYMSNALVQVGVEDPIVYLGRAISGMLTNDQDLETASTTSLADLIDALPPERRSSFLTEILDPTLLPIIGAANGNDNQLMLLRVLEILKAGAPRFRQIFDWSGSATPLPAIATERAPLINYRSPPADAPLVARRTVVAMRERIFPQLTTSRLLDIGPRFVDAACRYGWPAIFCPLQWNTLLDFQVIYQCCLEYAADVLIIDDHFIQSDTTHALRQQFFVALRQALPSIRIVALYLDSWQINPDFIRRTAPDVDALWATTPAMPHWRDPVFAGKLLQAPLAHAGHIRPPNSALPAYISFVGGLMGYNWHRVLWRAAAITEGLPIAWQLSTHVTDGLPPLDSYAAYMDRLAANGCSLNLAMRPDLCCVVTDRTFEALLVGTLLIQEAAPDIDYFLVAGEHYLAFNSFADLREVAELLKTQPETLQAIRRAGHEFAVARYADEKLVGYLDALLFHPSFE